jgi:hypothetical protein
MTFMARAGGAIITATLAVVAVLLLVGISSVAAQTNTGTGAGNSLKVSPLRSDVQLRPGESRNISVYVENLETQPITLKPMDLYHSTVALISGTWIIGVTVPAIALTSVRWVSAD